MACGYLCPPLNGRSALIHLENDAFDTNNGSFSERCAPTNTIQSTLLKIFKKKNSTVDQVISRPSKISSMKNLGPSLPVPTYLVLSTLRYPPSSVRFEMYSIYQSQKKPFTMTQVLGLSKGSSESGPASSSPFRYHVSAMAIFICFLLFSQEANSLATPSNQNSSRGIKRIAIL